MNVYIEIGAKRTFAGALDWPGWCRGGRDEESALQALLDYGPRYAAVLSAAKLGFKPPTQLSELKVVERLKGDVTTDFGSPGKHPAADAAPLDGSELQRLQGILQACWKEFDATVRRAKGKSLRKGPRGGGRDLEKIVEHVIGADGAYLSRLGWKLDATLTLWAGGKSAAQVREAILQGLAAAAAGELPAAGPRGAKHWSPRYFVRRVAWHVLDHAWEIEDRLG